MRLALSALAFLCAVAVADPVHAADAAPASTVLRAGHPRVFVTKVTAAQQAGDIDTAALADAILVAARRHTRFDVIGASDLHNALNVEAERQAVGCDDTSCLGELADALNARQIITAQLGHIGATWLLTLTRLDRDHMQVLARIQVQSEGAAPDVLLSRIAGGVDEVLGPDSSPLVPVGVTVAVVGALCAGGGGILHALAFANHDTGVQAKAAGNLANAATDKQNGILDEQLAYVGYVAGGALIIAGVTVAIVGALSMEAQP